MGVIVTWNYNQWVATFPQFAYLTAPQALLYFNIATSYCRNDGGGPVANEALQLNLLNLMTAHIAQLFAPTSSGASPSGLVGRISNASEGSVSVAVDMPSTPNAAWFNQTPFGAAYWQMTAPFRTMRYRPAPVRPYGPWGNGIYGGNGLWW